METLDSTIVNTALPAMAASFGVSPLSMHSVITAYSLTLAVLIPASGWISDRFGIRRTFVTAITVFSIGSILCALSSTLGVLVLARVLQGIGGSMLMPVGRLAILRVFPASEFLAAMSFVAVPALVGPLVGPPLGGFLVEYAQWHWIFLINIPVGLIGVFATFRYMPSIRQFTVARFDFKGFGFLAVTMVTLSLALEGVADFGFSQAMILFLVMIGMAALAAYVLHALRDPDPLFDLRIFRTRSFSIGLLGNLFARIGSAAMPFLIPLVLQVALGATPIQAGATMIPVALAAIACRRYAPQFILRIGYRRFLVANTFALGVVIASLALVSAAEPSWLRVVQFIVFGTLNSLQFSAMNSLTLKDLQSEETAGGNSLLSMTQMLAMSFGIANAGAILSTFGHHFAERGEAPLRAFQMTFVCLGALTAIATVVFAQLRRNTHNEPPATPLEVR